jgi:hypothetical protein
MGLPTVINGSAHLPKILQIGDIQHMVLPLDEGFGVGSSNKRWKNKI